MTDWFARPVLHVKDVDASVLFYVKLLGFTSRWRYFTSRWRTRHLHLRL
jgi:hypothetical protein